MGRSRHDGYLIDTSVVISLEQGRPVGPLPDDGPWAISVLSIGELHHGVLRADDPATRSVRMETWHDARATFTPLPVTSAIAGTWAEYHAIAAMSGRSLPVADGLIAATAATHGLVLVTQDRGFEWYEDLDVLLV